MTPMVWHQGIHDRMGMQRMRREGVESAPGLVPWRGKGRSGTGVIAWCLSEFVCVVSNETQEIGAAINRPANLLKDKAEQGAGA